jgi:predicted DNA-binding transcriptional regulator AlpA
MKSKTLTSGTKMHQPKNWHFFPLRRGLRAPDAANYIGVGTSMFYALVKSSRMPAPRMIGACRVWDVEELDAAFKSLPVEGEHQEINTWADLEQK